MCWHILVFISCTSLLDVLTALTSSLSGVWLTVRYLSRVIGTEIDGGLYPAAVMKVRDIEVCRDYSSTQYQLYNFHDNFMLLEQLSRKILWSRHSSSF